MRKLLLSLIVLAMTQSIQAQEKPTKESRKRDKDAVEAKVEKKREEIRLKREANLKEWWLWHTMDFSVRPLFNPCWQHWNRGEFLAQPRLESLDHETEGYVEEILAGIPHSDSQLQRKLRRLHLWGWDPILRTPRVFDYEHLAIEDFVEWVPTRIKF